VFEDASLESSIDDLDSVHRTDKIHWDYSDCSPRSSTNGSFEYYPPFRSYESDSSVENMSEHPNYPPSNQQQTQQHQQQQEQEQQQEQQQQQKPQQHNANQQQPEQPCSHQLETQKRKRSIQEQQKQRQHTPEQQQKQQRKPEQKQKKNSRKIGRVSKLDVKEVSNSAGVRLHE
jgi:hypothetical protein